VAGRRVAGVLVLLALAALPGCAHLCLGGVESILITSEPPGAAVEVDGEAFVTPVMLAVPRNSEPVVRFAGLAPIQVRRTYTAWLWLDLPLILPAIIDGQLRRGDLEPDKIVLRGGRAWDAENDDLLAERESAP